MELKAKLKKPYSEEQRSDFIVENNHILGYEIKETNVSLESWGLTKEEELQQAKENKYNEANEKAKQFLNTEATFALNDDFHVEATKENATTLGSAFMAINTGYMPYQEWTSKEDNVLQLNAEQCITISIGIGAIQTDVWTRQFVNYKNQIDNAQTIQGVNNIRIEYTQ